MSPLTVRPLPCHQRHTSAVWLPNVCTSAFQFPYNIFGDIHVFQGKLQWQRTCAIAPIAPDWNCCEAARKYGSKRRGRAGKERVRACACRFRVSTSARVSAKGLRTAWACRCQRACQMRGASANGDAISRASNVSARSSRAGTLAYAGVRLPRSRAQTRVWRSSLLASPATCSPGLA